MKDKEFESNMDVSTKWMMFTKTSLGLEDKSLNIGHALSRSFNIYSYQDFVKEIELINQKKSKLSRLKRSQLVVLLTKFLKS